MFAEFSRKSLEVCGVKKIFCLFFVLIFFFASVVHAEIQTYEDVGEFVTKNETLDFAKNQAKKDAIRNIAEKIFVEVQSNSEIKNSELTHDEIILRTENFLRIVDVRYKFEEERGELLLKAFVTAEIDTAEISNF